MYPVIINGISAGDLRGLIKGRSTKFRVGCRVRQETSEEGWRAYRLKRCEYNDKDEVNSRRTLNDENY